ncbi:P-loop containing nucleoside triphosphate hydrolase [Glarea lozoyensis ATCC 20868]|uniref:p-loop containing nucleoside triphosphate hydrolase n=1 Tax=Glarea lozoyensis (strain ATCC 20868 / MF5171) TaxID=1116229 RepID=S3CLZ8_GLAL2|nr:P-loop containing nucleoside triphosphate hydrolase [Glarea lozoyensis ATCC 20868]EPE27532.1 P-loop containing nucleoside triphosphate hydrolase [Glarea lozoyensis ATCC 20868]
MTNDTDTASTWTDSPVEKIPNTTPSLEGLQTQEQRLVLDTVAKIRKCGLEGTVSLPQIVVCGDQSSGKSSLLEALTGIPFPRADDLCTRYATEISLRLEPTESISIKIIPDERRSAQSISDIQAFQETITDFNELPRIMEKANTVMGIRKKGDIASTTNAIARDVLSIEIAGPGRPQLTLVDIPGLVRAESKNSTQQDIDIISAITEHYIAQTRTICLPVIAASYDHVLQEILKRVRIHDKEGDRTLGVITKPDRLSHDSGAENTYIDLAKNQHVLFKLGWHVIRNRNHEERNVSLTERSINEDTFFSTSNWKHLPSDTVGIDNLRRRLSVLLFDHVKKELPSLREELEEKLSLTLNQLNQLGISRSTGAECKEYLAKLSLQFYELSKAAVDGHYEHSYFRQNPDPDFNLSSSSTICRARAVVQSLNTKFSEAIDKYGKKYDISLKDPEEFVDEENSDDEEDDEDYENEDKDEKKQESDGEKEEEEEAVFSTSSQHASTPSTPVEALEATEVIHKLTKKEGIEWVRKALIRNRGKELIGNFNPLLIGQLFWDTSENWYSLALKHINQTSEITTSFLRNLLKEKCPEDIEQRIWNSRIHDVLRQRYNAAVDELDKLWDDHKNYPINYNHYYTDTIAKRRQVREQAALEKAITDASQPITWSKKIQGLPSAPQSSNNVNIQQAVANYSKIIDPNMDTFSCEEVLDCVDAIYKVSKKTFVANVTTQVIERHLLRGLEMIFSPIYVNSLDAAQAEALASEPLASRRKREFLVSKIKKLKEGQEIFRGVM